MFNFLEAEVSDIDYFYSSRLPGEVETGIDDIHFHPLEKRGAIERPRCMFPNGCARRKIGPGRTVR